MSKTKEGMFGRPEQEEIKSSEWSDCTGDVVVGDIIRFDETVWSGYRSKRALGDRQVIATVVADSYGAAKQQHTFSLEVISSSGCEPLEVGKRVRRKGRNVYRNGTQRQPWLDEGERFAVQRDKHSRGDAARAERDLRRAGGW